MNRFLINIICLLFSLTLGAQSVSISGSLELGLDTMNTPKAGTIRWTGSDFQGFDGSHWLSLISENYVKDGDGNKYGKVKIGSQTWLNANLRTTKYNNGDTLPRGSNLIIWKDTIPSFVWFNNDSITYNRYGALYNFYTTSSAHNGGRNVCPIGWHVPSKDELDTLKNHLQSNQGGKLKKNDLSLWITPNTGANNSSGFSAIGAGRRGPSGTFAGDLDANYLRTTTVFNQMDAYYGLLVNNNNSFNITNWNKSIGMSIRCIQD